MYHHRYQPQTSNIANRNPNAYSININHFDSNKNTSPIVTAFNNPLSNQSRPSSLVESSVTPTTSSGRSASPSNALSDSTAQSKSSGSGTTFNAGNTYRANNSHSSPFSSLPKQFVEERQDVIFRKVRGILNKITPETFDKLTKELVNVGLDSPRTLRGVIYLLFDKALKDLKYSSLYAKLCQELSEKAPNFERESGPNTFCKFLISKCEDEFERRRKATEDFDSKNELTDEEFEQRAIVKQKMLGNIKFICELGKKRLLQEEILHECIRGLLSKKKKEKPIQDQAQDLECLCQIMRTIGGLLDIEASKNLMNQYFERIDMFSKKPELPSRIRFMLRDVIDLRNNNWRPRPFQREDNVPQPLSKLREELGYSASSPNHSIDKLGNKYINNLSKSSGKKLDTLLLDDEPSFTTTTDFNWGSPFLPEDPTFDIFSNTLPKAESASATKGNNATIRTTLKPPVRLSDMPKYGPPMSQFMGDTFGSFNMATAVEARLDPFSDSFKTNNAKINLMVNHNNDDKRTATNHCNQGPFGFSKPPDFCRDDNIRAPMRDSSFVRNGPPPVYIRNNDSASFRNDRGQIRPNPGVNVHGFLHDNRDFRRQQAQSFISRAPFGDPDKPLINRGLENPNCRPPAPVQALPNQRPMQPHSNAPFRQQRHQFGDIIRVDAPRNDFNTIQDRVNHRDRRLYRNMNEQKQPRFSGSNYRFPGLDRNLIQQISNRDRIPESELSQNWRADNRMLPQQNSALVSTQPIIPKLSNQKLPSSVQSIESKFVNIALDQADAQITNSKDNQEILNKPGIASTLDKISKIEPDRIIEQSCMHRAMMSNDVDRCSAHDPANMAKIQTNSVRNVFSHEARSSEKDKSVVREKGQRRDMRPAVHPPSFQTRRTLNNELKDKREIPRRPIEPPMEFDGRVFQRPHPNESPCLERRGHKNAMPRNQSFDSPNNNEIKKTPFWRKDGLTNNNSSTNIPKDSITSVITQQLIPKTSARTTDPNFSLRPSHNFNGRSHTSATGAEPKVLTTSASTNGVDSVEIVPQKQSSSTGKESKIQDSRVDQLTPVESMGSKANSSSPSKIEPVVNQFSTIFFAPSNKEPADILKMASKIKELKITKQNQAECLIQVLKQSIVGCEVDRDHACRLLTYLIPSIFDAASLLSAYSEIFEQLQGMEVETPKVKSFVASHLGQTTTDGILTISDVASMLFSGKHHPLFLLYLQKLDKLNGNAWLSEKFAASKLSLMDMLPEVDRSKERLAVALKDRCLGFLDPMLTIEPDLLKQLKEGDPSPAAIYRWIKENVDHGIQGTTTFAYVFIHCLLRYIHEVSTERTKNVSQEKLNEVSMDNGMQGEKNSPVSAQIQALSECEKELLSKYQHILQAILKDKPMQLASLYALQSFYHGLDFPKGALLRWFHLFYDMSIVDDDVYFMWKEEINDLYPGKGQALFQVNTWLHWLAEAESEDEDDE